MADTQRARLDPAAVLREAWGLFRRDRDILLRVTGLFLFLPSFALALLVPPPPLQGESGGEAAAMAWLQAVGEWARAHGGWYLLVHAFGYLGAATLYALYLDRRHLDVGGAAWRAGGVLPRYLLAKAIVALPAVAGLQLLLVPGLYVLGRAMMTGPALLGERLSALGAIRRSLWLSRGLGLPLMWLASVPVLGGVIARWPFALLDGWMRSKGAVNPVALAIVDAGASLVEMAAALASILIALVVYRRLAA